MQQKIRTALPIPLAVAVAVFVAIAGAFLGSGALGGTSVQNAADGWLGADSTPLAPGVGAFSIWSVIYLGLAVYGVWQLGAGARSSVKQTRLRPLAAASALLNALWLAVVQGGWLGISVLVMLALLLVLIRMFMLMTRQPMARPAERWIMWLTFGPYLGWVSVATLANIAAWLASRGIGSGAAWTDPTAVALIIVAVLIGAGTVLYARGRVWTSLAMVWGIGWIGVGRSDGGLGSETLALTAFIGAGTLLVFTLAAGAKLTADRRRTTELAA